MNFFAGLMNPARGAVPNYSAADAVRDAAENGVTLLDVRGHDEVAMSGKAKDAVHIPLMLVQHHADPRHPEFNKALDPSKPVAVYCASGARSRMATQMLNQMGYAQVHNIGGFGDWVAAGGSVAR
ncbi:MAG: rhodanese-like domain-containing protein [Paracoccaceae bacterium]|nr:rhodanese-like domain-containing protein [Paracoccaceae bacterium]